MPALGNMTGGFTMIDTGIPPPLTRIPVAVPGIFVAVGAASSSADRCHSLRSLHPPPAALPSLPPPFRQGRLWLVRLTFCSRKRKFMAFAPNRTPSRDMQAALRKNGDFANVRQRWANVEFDKKELTFLCKVPVFDSCFCGFCRVVIACKIC